jgi:enoyl-CoA hydratase
MPLRVERRERVAVLTLDDPERRNALSGELIAEIVAAMDDLERDDGVGALVVTGAPPAFCSGADVGHLDRVGVSGNPAAVRALYDGFLRIRHTALPTVAAVNGPAVGAGFNLALACDVRLASPSARFDSRFLRIGLHPGGGHTWMLERAVGPQATAAMVLYGERLDGERAAAIGLAWRCVPDDELLDTAVAFAARAAEASRELVARTKRTLASLPWQPDFDAAVTTELDVQWWSFGLRTGTSAPAPASAPSTPPA